MLGVFSFAIVAGAGVEPAPGGYAYHYNFRCHKNLLCGLDYTFTLYKLL